MMREWHPAFTVGIVSGTARNPGGTIYQSHGGRDVHKPRNDEPTGRSEPPCPRRQERNEGSGNAQRQQHTCGEVLRP